MKNYFLLGLLTASLTINAQTNCDDANAYLVNAYSHVKDAYESNNISHLKYYANRSVESFILSKEPLITCGCKSALNLANESIELLTKVEGVESFEDGRFYVKRARDLSKESVIEIDKCAYEKYNNSANTSDELSDIEKEQLALQEQQEALKLKAEQLKTRLAQQNKKELILKKKQLVLSYNNVIASNIKTYNNALKVCNCSHESIENPKHAEADILTKSVDSIKNYYTNNLKELATNYINELNSCN